MIEVSVVIDAPPAAVWRDLSSIASHVEWMADAESIRFTTSRRQGLGTEFDCATRVGPIRLIDHMVVTEWEEGALIGVHHEGVVQGTGRFTLERQTGNATRLTWSERLRFPWWLGGSVGAVLGRVVLRRIWTANLGRFRARLAGPPEPRR
ncbi:MAG TPA: SRPBCC family protein [Acidimicrobiales bacterium]|jgi:uncharacterized protein YndB with AHSA1/START domain